MRATELIVNIFLVSGILFFAFTSIGLLVARGYNDQIHYLAPGTVIGSVSVALAVTINEGFTQAGMKALLIIVLMVISNPVLSHAIARAGRIRRKHQLAPTKFEKIPFAKDEPWV